MTDTPYRAAIAAYIRAEASPPDKLSHQPRLYALACDIAAGLAYDDDVLFAACYLHDLGVFIGHRPADPELLASWDNVAYAADRAPELLRRFGFPEAKIDAVCAAIRQHLPASKPQSVEATILRDADILEQLGAIGILRNVSKVGRDTRYRTFEEAIALLRRNLESLPARLRLERSRTLVGSRIMALAAFLAASDDESYRLPL